MCGDVFRGMRYLFWLVVLTVAILNSNIFVVCRALLALSFHGRGVLVLYGASALLFV